MSCRACLLSAGGLLAVVASLSPLWAAPAPNPEVKKSEATGTTPDAIRKALDSPNDFEFKDLNLAAIIATIAEQYKIQIIIDRNAIMQMGISPEEMIVELNMKKTKLRTALRALVSQYNLTFAVADGTLLITTEETAVYRQLKQRVDVNYDNVPLQTAVKELAGKCGVNVVFDPKAVKAKTVMNPVTLQADDIPFEAAVRLMCEMADLKPARMGNVIYVTTEARADKLKDSESLVPAPKGPINPDLLPNGGMLGFAGGGIAPMPAVAPPAKVEDKAVPDAPAPPKL